MTTNFTASNGDTIETRPNGCLVVKDGHYIAGIGTRTVDTLREYLQHQRDTELGRWRDPENPDMVVYHLPSAKREATGRRVRVLDERLGATVICSEHLERSSDPTNAEPSAARWFASHPEPKPWHSAEHEEVWEITANGDTGPALATTSNKRGQVLAFQFANGTLIEADSDEITTGRRIFPEDSPYHPVHPDKRSNE